MKLFIVVLAVFLTFSDARNPEADRLLKSGFRSGGFVKKLATRFNDRRGSYRDPATANVTVSAQWSYTDGDKVTALTISAKNLNSAQWAAVGLGQNKSSMGEAHVFMCKRLANDTIVLNRYMNPGGHQHPAHSGSEQGGTLTLGPQTLVDGVVTCQFNLSNFQTAKPLQLKDLQPLTQTGSYYPLFAVGVLLNTSEPYYHGNDSRTIIQDTVQLNQNTILHYRLTDADADGMRYYR